MTHLALLAAVVQNAVALFIIIDPFGALPVFAGLMRDMPSVRQRQTINLGVVVAIIILLIMAIVGRRVLSLFGVGLPELMVAGGIMLVIIGLDEIFGLIRRAQATPHDVGIVPIACPLLAGPGSIVTVMLAIQRNPYPFNYAVALSGIALAMGAAWLVLYNTTFLMQILGSRGSLILAKLMGILVTAIGTHFVLQGLMDFWQTHPSAR